MFSRNDVLKFMRACGQTEVGYGDQADLYMKLIAEEYDELKLAVSTRNIVEIADACADLKWVIEGFEHTMQIPQQQVWDEVARSNLAKISEDGTVLRREDGKILKPHGWTAPDIKSILRQEDGKSWAESGNKPISVDWT
jgi:predicted HAD superfamily Cof-like phosphohydrolase